MQDKIRNMDTDLPDNRHDAERLKPEETFIDLPDVKDIPGQEHVVPAPLGEMADTTISSADEEGEGLWKEDDTSDMDSDITEEEKTDLDNAGYAIPDDVNLAASGVDSADQDGEELNEASPANNLSGNDLDIPGSEDDDKNEETGEEDEENNMYSLDDNDDNG